MRRTDREVTDAGEIADIISRCQVLRLAINTGCAPYLIPFNFGMEPDGMTLYIHGAMTGTKYDLLEKDNRVGFELDGSHELVLEDDSHECTMNYESVMGWGVVEEVTQEDQKLHALDCIMRQYHAEGFAYNKAPVPRTRILRLTVMERTAKRRGRMV